MRCNNDILVKEITIEALLASPFPFHKSLEELLKESKNALYI